MENFVLNLFSDQLSKVILNFHPSTINANFLSGKGSITNLRLNVDLINDFLNKPPHGTVPFVKFTEIRLSELRVEVTSYTNLKKAPIVLVIEEIHATAVEPLEYHLDPATAQKNKDAAAAAAAQQRSNQPPRQQYGLLHRILDNLSVKINRIHLTFQTLGKFKTLRRGIWTPPPISVTLENIEWISVSEAGNPGTPDSVWGHNELSAQQNRFRMDSYITPQQHRSYIIYKRLSMIFHLRLSSDERNGENSSALISNTQIDIHVAYIRRLRDAGVTGVDIDVLCHDIDINLDMASQANAVSCGCDVGSFVHMMIGLLHCYYKDRTFVDPLLPNGVRNEAKQQISVAGTQSQQGLAESTNKCDSEEKEEGLEIGPDDFLPNIAVMDDEESESDYEEEPDEEHDEAFIEWKRRYDMQKGGADSDSAAKVPTTQSDTALEGGDPEGDIEREGHTEKKIYKRKRKAVIVIASGAQQYEKLSFSLSVSRVNIKLFLPCHIPIERNNRNAHERHCVEFLLEGLVTECIWPKVTGEIGGHLQCSFEYLHILDLLQRLRENANDGTSPWSSVKLFPLLKIGTRLFQGHDIFSVPQHLKNGWGYTEQLAGGVDKCDVFPFMESRQTTWTWDRPRRGKRAFGLKSTISFVDNKLSRWSKTSVSHEACLGMVDVLADSTLIHNMMNVVTNQNPFFDARWLSGDWATEIGSDIVAAETFDMKNYLQPLPVIYRSNCTSSSLPSSELRTVTAHLSSINVRIPNPCASISSFGMADIICGITEATIIVSSDLPKSFLSGKIMACENENDDFPNDPSDISCWPESRQAPSSEARSSKFRLQVSVSNFEVDIVPFHLPLCRDDTRLDSLIYPTNVTVMTSLEQNGTNQFIFVTVLLHELECNANLRLLCGALQTFKHHSCNILRPNFRNQTDDKVSVEDDGGSRDMSLVVCFHVPTINLKCWGEDSDLQSTLLFQTKVKQFELGSESTTGNVERRSIVKVGIDCISAKVCSSGDMVEIISISSESEASQLIALGQRAAEACSLSNKGGKPRGGGGLSFRVEHCCGVDMKPKFSVAVDNKSPLAASLRFDALEVFVSMVVEALSLPVLEHNTSVSIGISIFSSIRQLCSIFASTQVDSELENFYEERARNTLIRMVFSEIILLMGISDDKSFLLLLKDIEIASGNYEKITDLVCKHCGSDYQTWLDAYHLLDKDAMEASDTFYALKLQQTVLDVLAGNNFGIVSPTTVLDYRFPDPKGSSKPSSFDVNNMKTLIRHLMEIGKSFASSNYTIYGMLHMTSSSDLSPTATRLHELVGNYHEKMQAVIQDLSAEVNSLKVGIFSKERERIGALALALSTASGWVRVGEDSSFSQTRIFTSATFWRYWMVLDKSVIILYRAPGYTAPSFIIPLHKDTKLRTISLSSSSNIGIVGHHLRQRGFALFDELEGMELFFVASNQTEYDMFVSAITRALMLMQADSTPIPNSFGNSSEEMTGTEVSSESVAVVKESSPPVASSSSIDSFSVFDAVVAAEIPEEESKCTLEEAEGFTFNTMKSVQVDAEGGSNPNSSDQLDDEETNETQMRRKEDESLSNNAITNALLPMRERLALAKGKSKLATSKFGSALRSASFNREEIKQKGSEKITGLKKSANTKLTSAAVLSKTSIIQATAAVRSTINEQSIRTDVNKSMSSAIQRLHIDDKVTRISTAVKHARSESQVMRQLSSVSDISRRKIGIAEENLNKPIKFDARETFSAISGHPSKVNSIASGETLGNKFYTQAERQKITGSWLVDVFAVCSNATTEDNETKDFVAKAHHQLKYKITLTDICSKVKNSKHSVERTIGELLVFHVAISEMLVKTNGLRDPRQSGVDGEDSSNTPQTAPYERLRVAGSLLARIIEGNTPLQSLSLSSVRDLHCEWIRLFASTLLESYLPEDVVSVTLAFFGMNQENGFATSKHPGSGALSPIEEPCAATVHAHEAFDTLEKTMSSQNIPCQTYDLVSSAHNHVGSHLLDTVMTAYTVAANERDAALASLAVSSVLNDHHILQEQLARSKTTKRAGSFGSDEEMLALCKQLGNEIAARTSAELEVTRLKEQLELERKIARTKESELREQLSKK